MPTADRLVEVALVGASGAPGTFTYGVPEALSPQIVPGSAVEVPLGRRRVSGFVVGENDGPAPKGLKNVAAILPGQPLPPDLIELTGWAARYYQVLPAHLLRAILPPSVRRRTRRQVVPTAAAVPATEPPREPALLPEAAAPAKPKPLTDRILARLPETGLDLGQLRRDFGDGTDAAVRRLAGQGRVTVNDVVIERREEVRALVAENAGTELRRAPRQAAIHEFVLARRPQPVSRAEVELRFPGSGDQVRRLLARGALRPPSEEELKAPQPNATAAVDLNAEQNAALSAIVGGQGRFGTLLLFGVTSSGKTEVYLQAASAVRAAGRSVLLLVPEIGLTPQLIANASRRFPGEIAVLHSALSDTERARTWHDISAGRTPVVIGARSAVFSPLPNLGLIVVDEEHDAAYKQEESPRYHGRDVAVMRGKIADIPVVLASATPSLESYQAALTGRYQLLEMPNRATESALPAVELIDLRDPKNRFPEDRPRQPETEGKTPPPPPPLLSPPLEKALVENYRGGEQSLVFLNRRGFARFIQCEDCGRVEDCPHCSVSLTLHRARGIATCHHCGFTRPPSSTCTDCGAAMAGRSFGTEQVEGALATLLPAARIARLDRDTGGSPEFVQETLAAWRDGELDVLVGTQMIAKGHDAPGVTLIGVILADASLHFPDFRASERTFQLLAQVAGRAGRGAKPGRVLVQTRTPDHPSLVAATRHDFPTFAEGELRLREDLNYPPFGRLARIVLEGDAALVERQADQLADRLRKTVHSMPGLAPGEVQVLGPAPAPIERLRGRYRIQLLLKAAESRRLAQVLRAARPTETKSSTRTIVDIDPISMM
ncbi:MAG: primosomal protein N' [Candidatus Binatia bacterium]|nr:primosomal protein N' [Candidatus Binatia bacterium]